MASRRNPYDNPFGADTSGYIPYEQGGITGGGTIDNGHGGTIQYTPPPENNLPEGATTATTSGAQTEQAKFDPYAQVGHEGSIGGMNREQWRDAWQGSGVSDIAGMKSWMGQHGGKVLSDNGTALTPFGETMDLLANARTGHGSAAWGGSGPGSEGPMPLSQGGAVMGPTGSGMSGPGGGGGYSGGIGGTALMDALKGLFPNGAFNKDALNARVSNQSDMLNRNRKSQLANTEAILAEHGQSRNDGTFGSALGNLESRLNSNYNQGVNEAYANESDQADQRMIQALSMATGMSIADAKNSVDMARIGSDERIAGGQLGLGYYNADIGKMLGQGNLNLGYFKAGNDFDLGKGGLNLGQQQLGHTIEQDDYDNWMKLMDLYMKGNDQANNGFIGNK